MRPAGLAAFALWNVLVVAMAVLTIVVMRQRRSVMSDPALQPA